MAHIENLTLSQFRSYAELTLRGLEPHSVVLSGPNGVGKTNILEALSLLATGRGLRGAKLSELQHKDADIPWIIAAKLQTQFGSLQAGIKRERGKEKKMLRLNGESAKNQTVLAEWCSVLWLTPQMDGLFLESVSARRRFFDRLVFTFDPGHSGRLTRYENAVSQRNKLLKDGSGDPAWFDGLERQIAETGVAIAASRRIYIDRLMRTYQIATEEESREFPQASVMIKGKIEACLEHYSALEAEEKFIEMLRQSRARDSMLGVTSEGVHRSDIHVSYAAKDMPAAQSSTGEQKALLIGILLSHARLLKQTNGEAPILLLDEVVAHLDPRRRKVLANILKSYGSQVWMTGTDAALFSDFEAQHLSLPLNHLRQESERLLPCTD